MTSCAMGSVEKKIPISHPGSKYPWYNRPIQLIYYSEIEITSLGHSVNL